MKALRILAGPGALAHIRRQGLVAGDIGVIPGAAGGPKGLILGPIDRFLFGEWLPASGQEVHLVGASIGAWRLASACLDTPVAALHRLEHDYIHQHYQLLPGQKRPSAEQVSSEFGQSLKAFYGGRLCEVLTHPRYRLHVLTSAGRHVLRREGPIRTPLGYAGAYLSNAVSRRLLGHWLHRVVFSAQPQAGLPFDVSDFPTRHVALTEANFMPAVQASCSIPFLLQAVHDIPLAPPGAHWDGGITDYHLHLDYRAHSGLVLYPHFQPQIVPGWLDKAWKRRHGVTPFLDRMVVLCPTPEWVATLPAGKLPDRTDFSTYAHDLAGRIRVWQTATRAAQQLADEWAQWLRDPGPDRVEALP
ncbi:MAG: phospholipase [Alphaproteobacteria bacterium]|nr:phospholipase [Alphaproteobacteria bacterium]